jgi:purine nucleosidase/pyrimidine-specific ribonucleoside hydrolase
MADVVAAAAEPVTLIATGPLTNVATFLERHPKAAGRLREIVIMGGATGRGNHTPYAEFNVYVDPEAAERVFAARVPVTMVGLNLTHQALAIPDVIARLEGIGTDLAGVVAAWMTFFAASYEEVFGLPGPPVHDACAVALAIDPTLVRCVDAFVAIETEGRWTRGATVVDLHGRLGRKPNARVAMELDADRFWALVLDAVAALGPAAVVPDRPRAGA